MGQVVFDSATAEDMAAAGVSVILLRAETSPEDVKGMHSAAGVLTQLGGMTSHAAVVARGWGRPCITGCTALSINDVDRTAALGGATLSEGDVISLNGATGEVVLGAVEVALPQLKGDVARFMEWVDGYRTLGVLANADTPADAKQVRTRSVCCPTGQGLCRANLYSLCTLWLAAALSMPLLLCTCRCWSKFVNCAQCFCCPVCRTSTRAHAQARENGAEGIGLVRTEHMFFATSARIRAVRRMIFADDASDRAAALLPIEEFQREDFEGIFEAMDGMPVTVRLLDPPLHEFLPAHDNDAAIAELAADVGLDAAAVEDAMARMQVRSSRCLVMSYCRTCLICRRLLRSAVVWCLAQAANSCCEYTSLAAARPMQAGSWLMHSAEQDVFAVQEVNPMLGFRGCRLAIAYPEVPQAQVRAGLLPAVPGCAGTF